METTLTQNEKDIYEIISNIIEINVDQLLDEKGWDLDEWGISDRELTTIFRKVEEVYGVALDKSKVYDDSTIQQLVDYIHTGIDDANGTISHTVDPQKEIRDTIILTINDIVGGDDGEGETIGPEDIDHDESLCYQNFWDGELLGEPIREAIFKRYGVKLPNVYADYSVKDLLAFIDVNRVPVSSIPKQTLTEAEIKAGLRLMVCDTFGVKPDELDGDDPLGDSFSLSPDKLHRIYRTIKYIYKIVLPSTSNIIEYSSITDLTEIIFNNPRLEAPKIPITELEQLGVVYETFLAIIKANTEIDIDDLDHEGYLSNNRQAVEFTKELCVHIENEVKSKLKVTLPERWHDEMDVDGIVQFLYRSIYKSKLSLKEHLVELFSETTGYKLKSSQFTKPDTMPLFGDLTADEAEKTPIPHCGLPRYALTHGYLRSRLAVYFGVWIDNTYLENCETFNDLIKCVAQHILGQTSSEVAHGKTALKLIEIISKFYSEAPKPNQISNKTELRGYRPSIPEVQGCKKIKSLGLTPVNLCELQIHISSVFGVVILEKDFEIIKDFGTLVQFIDTVNAKRAATCKSIEPAQEEDNVVDISDIDDVVKKLAAHKKDTCKVKETEDTNIAMKQVEATTEKKAKVQLSCSDVVIKREGSQITLPTGMSYDEGIVWLQRKKEAEEKEVEILDRIPCFPLDGLYALARAMKEIYGFTDLQSTPSFFGETPPMIVQIELANGEYAHAPFGRIEPPTFEGGYIETVIGPEPALIITGKIKRKMQEEVDRLLKVTKRILKEDSIYKAKAIVLDLSYAVPDEKGSLKKFHPLNDAPKFFGVGDITEDKLILNKVTKFELSSNIFTLIEKSADCRANGVPLKHGCLLAGPYGTGKTMTARLTASKAINSGWTFIYIKNPHHTSKALKVAELYAPAVVFVEDIDQVTKGQRDAAMNELLNTLDGIDTKHHPIITILTTNYVDVIQPGVMRAGRIDTVIQMDAPDKDTAQDFIRLYAQTEDKRSLLAPGIDLSDAGAKLAGFVPAFIAEAVHKAKKHAIHKFGPDILGKITAEDIENAAASLHRHMEFTKRKDAPTHAENVESAVKLLGEVITGKK